MSKEEKIVGQCKSSVSKELEALERVDDYVDKDYDYCQRGDYRKDYKLIKQALQRLEAIDKKRCGANVEKVFIDEFVPSKELEKEYLEDLDHYDEGMGIHSSSYEKCKERLIRLARIDQTKPSEEIEKLNELFNWGGVDKAKFALYYSIKSYILKAQEQDFNYNEIVIPFLNELAIILGINDIDEMLDKIKEQKKVLDVIKGKIIWVENDKLMCGRYADIEIELEEEDFENKEEFELVKRYFNER